MQFAVTSFSKSQAFMGFHGVMSDSGMPINQLGFVKFKCADKNGVSKSSNDAVSGLDGGISNVIEGGILSESTLEDKSNESIGTVIGGGILSNFTLERNDGLIKEEEEAAERERIREEQRKKEEEQVQAALKENQDYKEGQVVSPKIVTISQSNETDSETQSMLIVGMLLVSFIAIVAITAIIVLVCRKKREDKDSGGVANGADERRPRALERSSPQSNFMRQEEESQRAGLNN